MRALSPEPRDQRHRRHLRFATVEHLAGHDQHGDSDRSRELGHAADDLALERLRVDEALTGDDEVRLLDRVEQLGLARDEIEP